ncbi:hypothetical protein [Pseudomonas sp. BF-R-01]
MATARKMLDWPYEPFDVPDAIRVDSGQASAGAT